MTEPSMQEASARRRLPDRGNGWSLPVLFSFVSLLLVQEYVAFSFTFISTALPTISSEFETTHAGWLLSGFTLTGAVVSPLAGRLADIYGKRRILLVVLSIAIVGAVVTTTATSVGQLIAGRCLAGFAIAGLFLSYSLMRDIFPQRILPLALSLAVTGVGVIGVGAPFLIGELLDNFGTQGVFTAEIVLLLIVLAAVRVSTPESWVRKTATVDYLGGAILGAGIAALLFGVSMGDEWGWLSMRVLGVAAFAVAMLAGYAVHSRRTHDPVLDLEIFTRRPILMTALTGALAYAAFNLSATMVPMMVMTDVGSGYGLGMTASEFALLASPLAVATVAGGFFVGKAISRIGGRICMMIGLTLIIAGALVLATFHTHYVHYLIGAFLTSFGAGFCTASVPNLVIQYTPAEEQGSISGNVQVGLAAFSSAAPVLMFVILAANSDVNEAGGVFYTAGGFQGVAMLMVGFAGVALLLMATVFAPKRLGGVPATEGLAATNSR